MIKGGFILVARQIDNSDIAEAPPHVREIWHFLMRTALWKDGKELKRGQCLVSYKDIQEGLKWYAGWRKCTYSKGQCEISMKVLKKAAMITTKKTTRGMIVTILNYDYYQNIENYENYKEVYKKATRKPQPLATIDEEREKREKGNTPHTPQGGTGSCLKNYQYPDWLNKNLWIDFYRMRSKIKKPITTNRTITGLLNALKKLIDDGYIQDEIIQTAIDKCWLSFYAPKKEIPKNNDGPQYRRL